MSIPPERRGVTATNMQEITGGAKDVSAIDARRVAPNPKAIPSPLSFLVEA